MAALAEEEEEEEVEGKNIPLIKVATSSRQLRRILDIGKEPSRPGAALYMRVEKLAPSSGCNGRM